MCWLRWSERVWLADVLFLLRRSATLRTYAGDTSLPGGKVDPEDKSIEDTAVSYLCSTLVHDLP